MPRDRRMDEAQGPGAGWCPAHRHGHPSVCTAFKTSPEGKSPAGRIYMSRKGAELRAAALPFLGTGARVVGAAAVSAEAQVGCLPALGTEIWLIWARGSGCSR